MSNNSLADLPRADFALVEPHLAIAPFKRFVVLAEADTELSHVYFPLSGMISLVITMSDGKAIETATIGKDGFFGASSGFAVHRTPVRAVVQVTMTAAVIPAPIFRRLVDKSKGLQTLCIQSNERLLAQARITAACNALHQVETRFCRWLVQTRDVTENNQISLTQELLSEMLGVRRTSITEAAKKLQDAGLIIYSRGVIQIINYKGLVARACECVEMLREQRAI